MFRYLYGRVLDAHPPYFRQRFGEEMAAIFDESESGWAAARLFADAVVSLVRQWTLRPQFWKERAAAANGGLFPLLENSGPRAVALVYGAVVSAIVLNGVSLTIGYAWNHPHYMQIRQPVMSPPASWRNAPAAQATPGKVTEPSLHTDQGRVLLIFNAPAHAKFGDEPGLTSDDELPRGYQAYVGSYRSSFGARIELSARDGRLQLEIDGAVRSNLVPSSQSNLMNCISVACSVSFSTNDKGAVDHIEVRDSGRQFVAFRQRSGMIF